VSPVRCLRVVALAALCLALHLNPARAEIIVDPRPPMRWKELVGCELVVTARYKAHQGGKLSLEVVRVLRGKGVRPGDVLTVALEHWYSVQTRPTGFEARPDRKPDGVPRLCYKQQLENPGPAVPLPILADVRKPAVYFFPKGAAPALVRRGQVQPPFLADGWQQALDKKPMDLLFRLVQRTDPDLAHDALEELYAKRDPRTLDRLFAWLLNPPPEGAFQTLVDAAGVLVAVGDRKGDVYDRALKPFAAEVQGTNPYARFALGRILATADPGRAAKEFARFLKGKSPGLRETTAYCVGHLGNEQGLDLACGLLADPALANPAVASLRTLLEPGYYGRRRRPAEWARLRELARPRLRAAVASPKIPEPVKQQLRQNFRDLVDEPPALDFPRVEKALLNPAEKTYQGIIEGEAHRAYKAAVHTFDARFVPLLARVLREVPAARGQQAYRFREALLHYAAVCPNALKAELTKQGVDLKGFRDAPHELSVRLAVRLRSPRTLDQLAELSRERWGDLWLRRKLVSPEPLNELRGRIEHGLGDSAGPYPWDVGLLLKLDPAEGRLALGRALARRERSTAADRAVFLALAVRHGRAEHLDELLRLPVSPSLLLAADDRALARYLKDLDAGRSLSASRLSNRKHLDYRYTGNLSRLFPAHAPAFFERVLGLLESPHLPEREAGVEALERALHWDCGFRAEDFAAARAERLTQIRPLLKRLASLSQPEIWAAVLRELGVKLEGKPGPRWVPALTKAALSADPAVAANALLLLEEVTDAPGCYEFARLPGAERERVLLARLRDEQAGRPKATRLTPAKLEALWGDLAGALPRAYPARAALLASPEDSLPFLKEKLRPVPAADAARVKRLIAELGDKRFAVREKAMADLQQLGEQAAPLLREALRTAKSLEARRRLETLLKGLDGWSAEKQRTLRALDVLESVGTPPARTLLQSLAGGLPGCFLTREAQAALRRLGRRLPGS
jgi:hypothetical protein